MRRDRADVASTHGIRRSSRPAACGPTLQSLVERDLENAWLAADTEARPLDDLPGHSITYRIAVGPRAGQKLFTLQTVAPRLQGPEGEPNGAARAGGFSAARSDGAPRGAGA